MITCSISQQMKAQLLFLWLFTTLSLPGLGQSLDKSFIGKSGPYTEQRITQEYHLEEDGSFVYRQYHHELKEGHKLITLVSKDSGNYLILGDTLKLSGHGIYPLKRSLLLDPTQQTAQDFQSYPSLPMHYDEVTKLIRPRAEAVPYLAVIDSKFQDTTYHRLPANNEGGGPPISMEFAIEHFHFLSYLKQATLRAAEGGLLASPADHAFDSQGRLVRYCVSGWFNMSSIPWTINIEYDEASNLIKKISHDSPILSGDSAYEGSFQEFSYDKEGNLTLVDFYTRDGELSSSYEMVIVE